MTLPTRRRRIMHAFKISEISAVDNPAQEAAKAVLMKRADPREDPTMHKVMDDHPRGFDTFEDAVAAIANATNVPRHAAMTKARGAYPALFAAYQKEGDDRVAKAAEATAKPPPVSKAAILAFDDRVDALAKARGLPRHAAMSMARQRFPDECEAAYGRSA